MMRAKAAADGGWQGLPPTSLAYGGTGVNFVIRPSMNSDCTAALLFSTQDGLYLIATIKITGSSLTLGTTP
ncbi:MAG: hypothetical protein LUD83_09870, partial [Clostridiales bacterium]|nr:hypothetical protein [Clostridiales bacterium]